MFECDTKIELARFWRFSHLEIEFLRKFEGRFTKAKKLVEIWQ
jgi:hypothetical protein